MCASVYCFVGRPGVPLCEYALPGTSGNYNQVTQVLSKKLPAEDGKVSYVGDAHTFHCLSSYQLHFVCLASHSFSRSVAFQFLAEVRARFFACYLPTVPLHHALSTSPSAASPISAAISSSSTSHASTPLFPSSFSIPLSLQSDFVRELSRLLSAYSARDVRLQQMRDSVAETSELMVDNLDALMERGERLELLTVRAGELEEGALRFKRSSGALKERLWWANTRLSLLTCGVAASACYLLISSACGGLTLPQCR